MKKQLFHNRELSDFCRSLSLLLHAGVGSADALSLLAEEEPAGPIKDLLLQFLQETDLGKGLAAVLKESGVFPDYLCGLLEVGEKTGRTEEALASLADHYAEKERMGQRLRAALLYPSLLLLIMLGVIVILLTKVLPVFEEVYAGLGSSLTGLAGGLLLFGKSLNGILPTLCILLGLLLLAGLLFALSPALRSAAVTFWQAHCGDKGLSRKINTARFAQALAMAMQSGLSPEEALTLSTSLFAPSSALQSRLQSGLAAFRKGSSLAQALSASDLLPPAECRLLELSLRSGSGDSAMASIAARLTEDSDLALERKLGQIEPALVLLTSALVGLILLSVMLPLMHITAAIG